VAVLVDVHNTLVVNALLCWGTEEQRRKWLPRLAADTAGAYALSEAGSGSDAFALQTRAERLPAAIGWTGASCGSAARARRDCSSSSPRSIRRRATRHHRLSDGERRAGIHRGAQGRQAGDSRQQHLRADSGWLQVPEANLLGKPGKGYKIAMETLNEGRIGIGAQMLGLAEGAWVMRFATPRNGVSSASQLRSFRRCSLHWPRWLPRLRRPS